MSEDSLKYRIDEFLKGLPDNYAIIEDQIPLEVQVAYFDFTRKIKDNLDIDNVLSDAGILYNSSRSLNDKKIILCKLASVPFVEAYRHIEKYCKKPDSGLEHWSKLALIESRMFLENYLTDESMVLISTGLGGKKDKLRYFVVCFSQNCHFITSSQKSIIKNEVETFSEKNEAETESLKFYEYYFTITCLLPVKNEIRELIRDIIRECNIYGNFLRKNFIVTNVKILKKKEIISFLSQMNKTESDEKENN